MITDREYVDQRFADLLLYVQGLRIADQDALKAARESLRIRLEGMNEFRQALIDQTATFMPRSEAEAQWGRTAERLNTMAGEHAGFVRRPEHDALAERLNSLEVRMTRAEGTDEGSSARTTSIRQTIVVSVAALGLVMTILIAVIDHFVSA